MEEVGVVEEEEAEGEVVDVDCKNFLGIHGQVQEILYRHLVLQSKSLKSRSLVDCVFQSRITSSPRVA